MARNFRIRWAPVAFQDLDEIIDYIATQDGTGSAVKMYLELEKRAGALATHPARCRIVPELREVTPRRPL